jgi:hypothetical protein
VGSGSKLNRAQIQNTIVKNGPKNPVSEVVLPIGFPASVQEAHIPARTNAWPHYINTAIIAESCLTNEVTVSSGWSSKAILQDFIDSNFQPVPDSKGQRTRFVITGTGAIESIKDREQASHAITVISGVGSTQSQSIALSEIGFSFPFPKPVDLVRYLISMIDGNDFLVLDSFAGSGTTAHAVLKQNFDDGGNRRFILVEMDEAIAKNVTAERVRRVAEGYTNAKGEQVSGLGGSFQFCTLSKEPLFTADGQIRADVRFAQLAEFIWFAETGSGRVRNKRNKEKSPLLGIANGRAVFLLYNGILGDRSDLGGNVLNGRTLEILREEAKNFNGSWVVYGARTRFDAARLNQLGIEFKLLPYKLREMSWA